MHKDRSFDDRIRLYKDKFLLWAGFEWLYKWLLNKRIAPNHLTILGFSFGCASTFFIFSTWQLFICLYFLYVLFDNLDGSYARYLGEPRQSGDDFDHFLDSVVWISLIISASINQGEWWTLSVIFVCIMNTILVFFLKLIKDWRARGVYIIFYFFGQNTLGLQAELLYVTITIIVRMGASNDTRKILRAILQNSRMWYHGDIWK